MGYGVSPLYGDAPYGGVANSDARIFEEIEYHMLENGDADAVFDAGAFPSSMWTQDEILGYISDRRRRFHKETGIVITRQPNIAAAPQKTKYDYPSDWIASSRLLWRNFDDSEKRNISRLDAYQADMGIVNWPSEFNTFPIGYHDLASTQETLRFELIGGPGDVGQMDLLYVAQPDLETDIISTFSWVIKYGAMEEMFSKEGEASDAHRAAYCRMRWEMGVELARILLGGTENLQ